MTKEITEVRDIPAEVWIKVLSGLAVVTLSLMALIGSMVIDKLDWIGETLFEVVGSVQKHNSEISRNTKDITEINIKVEGNTQEIYKLKGLK